MRLPRRAASTVAPPEDSMNDILFVCVANSARSQLAEAIARHLAPLYAPGVEMWSAGSAPSHVRPEVYTVLAEVGIDSRGLRAKGVFEVPLDEISLVVALCREEQCPVVPTSARKVSMAMADPASAPPGERIQAFRDTRDELIDHLPDLLRAHPRRR